MKPVFASNCALVDCRYRESKSKEQRNRLFLLLSQTVEWLKGEFLCPLCQFHCNAVLPLLSVKREVRSPSSEEEQTFPSFSEWLQHLCQLVQCNLQAAQKEEETSRVPGPACSTSSDEDQLTRIFPKYLKLQHKQNLAERCGVVCSELFFVYVHVCVCVWVGGGGLGVRACMHCVPNISSSSL